MNNQYRIFLAAIAVLSLSACKPKDVAQKKTEELKVEVAVPVRQYIARSGALTSQKSSNGILEAAQDSNIASQATGQVVTVFVHEGQTVAKGAPLVKLDDTSLQQDLANAKLSLQSAQTSLSQSKNQNSESVATQKLRLQTAQNNLRQAQQELTSNQNLFKLGGISEQTLDTYKTKIETARADLSSTQASLSQFNRAGQESLRSLEIAAEQSKIRIQQLNTNIARTTVRAPFSGEVSQLKTALGEYVNTGSAVVRLSDRSSMRISLGVPPADTDSLQVGKVLNVIINGETYKAKVSRSAGSAGENRLVQVFARFLPGQDISSLTTGTSAEARYTLTLGKGVLVPSGALSSAEGLAFVLAIKNDVLERNPVSVVAESGGNVVVDGLEAGQAIVYPMPSGLQSGQKVTVVGGN